MNSLHNVLTLMLALMLTTQAPAFAANLDILEGDYQAKLDQSSVMTAYEVEAVWTLNQAGQSRLEYLRKELKASCSHVGRGLYRCQRFIERTMPQKIQERIAKNFAGAHLVMSPESLIELLYKGEEIEEYLVHQNGVMTTPHSSQNFENWRYFFGMNDLEKIQAGKLNPSPYSFVRRGDVLDLVLSESITLDRFRFQVWLVSLPFERAY